MGLLPQLLVVGLGNLPLPLTRHRYFIISCGNDSSVFHLTSIGHLIVDSLATRLGIKLSNQKGGYTGQSEVQLGEKSVSLTLFKPSALSIIFTCSIKVVV